MKSSPHFPSESQLPSVMSQSDLPEWELLERSVSKLRDLAEISTLGYSSDTEKTELKIPLVSISLGSRKPTAPTLIFTGGVHGLERIGSQVVLSTMDVIGELLKWDRNFQKKLEDIRIAFFPMINPVGILNRTRSNPNGVDLMRNSPSEAEEKASFLVGGHRFSKHLPWFRGNSGLEVESQALIEFTKKEFFQSSAVVAIDVHSGFGLQDRLWFPYAKSKRQFHHLPEAFALLSRFDQTHPHHFYKIEPQSVNYTTHGDLWDYIYDEYRKQSDGVFIPLCLEMGSWNWLRKNPLQIFSRLGPYNPIKSHRQKRVLRRHWTFTDFLIRAIYSSDFWAELSEQDRTTHLQNALARWYK